jgi:hypothetical protein
MTLHPDAHLLRRVPRSPEQILSHVTNAEGFLAAAVIQQAFWDSGWMTGSGSPAHDGTFVERTQAHQFLLSTRGEWAAARETWAVAAGMCPDYVRDLALKLSKAPRQRRQNPGKTPGPPRQDVVDRVRERVDYLRSQGVDLATAWLTEIVTVLNAGGFTSPCGLEYDSTRAGTLRDLFLRCVKWGVLQ